MSNKNNHPDSPVIESTVVKASDTKNTEITAKESATKDAKQPNVFDTVANSKATESKKADTKDADNKANDTKASDVKNINYERALQILKQRFSNAADFHFIIVGNASPDSIKSFLTKYIAVLPANSAREQFKDASKK